MESFHINSLDINSYKEGESGDNPLLVISPNTEIMPEGNSFNSSEGCVESMVGLVPVPDKMIKTPLPHETETLSYRFVPLKVENIVESAEEDEIPLDPMISNDGVRLALVPPSDNQVYVVNHVDSGQRPLRPKPVGQLPRMTNTREERRRVTHNEVERRRRDKINTWICKLAKILPDGANLQTKTNQSKGAILSKACDYIEDLRCNNDQYVDQIGYLKEKMTEDIIFQEVEVLKIENTSLRNENCMLKEKLKENGLMLS